MSIKILYINTSDGRGGAARLVMDLKSGIDALPDFETSLFVKEKHSKDASVFSISKPGFFYNKLHYILSNDIEFFDNHILFDSSQYKEADIIHLHNLHNVFFNLENLERISQEKIVIWSLHDMWAITPHEAWLVKDDGGKKLFSLEVKPNLFFDNRKYLFQKKKEIYDKSRLNIIYTSKWFEPYLKKGILQKQKSYLIHNGIDTDVYKPRSKNEARATLALPTDRKIITLMSAGGRHNKQKGWEYAEAVIKHFRDRNDVLFLVVGGKESDQVSNKNVVFRPYVQNENGFAKYYNVSDIFLHTSEAEAFSLVVGQALSSEIPVIAFPVGVVEEAVEHKISGYIAKYQDIQDLISGVEFMLNKNDNEREEMGKHGRQTIIKNFSKDIMIQKHADLYRNLLNQRQSS